MQIPPSIQVSFVRPCKTSNHDLIFEIVLQLQTSIISHYLIGVTSRQKIFPIMKSKRRTIKAEKWSIINLVWIAWNSFDRTGKDPMAVSSVCERAVCRAAERPKWQREWVNVTKNEHRSIVFCFTLSDALGTLELEPGTSFWGFRVRSCDRRRWGHKKNGTRKNSHKTYISFASDIFLAFWY